MNSINSQINLGEISIDGYKFAVNANAILGTRNAGKTYTGKYIAESLMDINVPVIILDPVGRWRYMNQENPDNQNGKSYPVIVVGKNADVELSLDTIENVIMMALQTRSSIVIDLYDKEYAEIKNEVVAVICEKLFYENEKHGLRTLIVEESADFLGQTSKKTIASVWLEQLTRYSGNVKLGVVFINQNAESLSKAVLKLCKGMIVGIQNESNSINMVRKWFSDGGVANPEVVSKSLPCLTSGQFWVWATYLETSIPVLTKIPLIRSYHPSRETITENDIRPAENFNSVISMMNSATQNKKYQTISYSFPKLDFGNFEVSEEKAFEIFTDWESLGSDWESRRDYVVMNQAKNNCYGNSTVKNMVENLVKKGYKRFISMGDGIGRLESETFYYNLHGKIECDFAEVLVRRSF